MQMFNPHFTVYCYKLWAWINMYPIYRCLSSASAVIRSWFVYELHKSTTIAFSRNSLYTFYSWNSTCEIPPNAFGFPIVNTPLPSEFHNREPPSPSEILKAVCGIGVDIFWNRPIGRAFLISPAQDRLDWTRSRQLGCKMTLDTRCQSLGEVAMHT